MSRITSDPKETTIKIRINEDMREHIEKSARKRGITKSEYVRQLIGEEMISKSTKGINLEHIR